VATGGDRDFVSAVLGDRIVVLGDDSTGLNDGSFAQRLESLGLKTFGRDVRMNEMLRIKFLKGDLSLGGKQQDLPRIVADVSAHRIVEDCGEVRIEPGQRLWAHWSEPFTSLQKKAAESGANVITDLQILHRKDGQRIPKYGSPSGFKARALLIE